MAEHMIAEPITVPGLYDLTNEEYHADPVPDGSLSSSGARKILKAPALFKHSLTHPEFKDIYDFGHVAHKLALEDDEFEVVVVEADSWRTNVAKAKRDEARERGAVALLRDDYTVVEEMVAELRRHRTALALLSAPGKSEQAAFWEDPETGLMLRAKFDRLPEPTSGGRLIVPDYKTAASAEPEAFAKAAMNHGYHQQDAWYEQAPVALGIAEDVAFVFVVQEKKAPYLVTVVELDLTAKKIGAHLNRKAIHRYLECQAADYWPGYTDEVAHVSLPYYYTREFEEVL